MSRLVGAGSEEGSSVGMTRRGSGRATYGRNNEYENNHHQTQNFTTDPDKIRVLSLYRMGVLLYNVVSERYAQMTSK